MEVIDYKSKGFKAVIVALNNCQVHIYKEKYLVNVIKTDDVVTGLKFGQFGREEGTLIMTLKGNTLIMTFKGKTLIMTLKGNTYTTLKGNTYQINKFEMENFRSTVTKRN